MSDDRSAATPSTGNAAPHGYVRVDPLTGELQWPGQSTQDAVNRPPPTAPDPAPPELIPDDCDAIAVCLSPDVCRSPIRAVPYMVWGKADDDSNYSPDVRSNGKVIKRQDSRFTCTYGDEPGEGLGIKSGTVGDVVEPVTSSAIVRANGIPVQRHTDRCTLNRGNCPGEYVHVKSTDVTAAPDGADEQDRARSAPVAELRAYEPSWAERVRHSVQDGLMALGMDRYPALKWGEKAETLAGFVPGLGNAISADDSKRAYERGQPVLGTIHAIGAIPIPGAAKVAEKIGAKVAGDVAESAAARAAAERSAAAAESGALARQNADTAGRQAVEAGQEGARSTRLGVWREKEVNGRRVYQRDDLIDLHKKGPDGRTNLERMRDGDPPIGPDDKPINLHHMTQEEPGSVAEVAQVFHKDNHRILHMYPNGQAKIGYGSAPPPIDRAAFRTWSRQYWRTRASDFQ